MSYLASALILRLEIYCLISCHPCFDLLPLMFLYSVACLQIRALEKKQKAGKYAKKVKAKKRRKIHELSNPMEPDEFADMWKE